MFNIITQAVAIGLIYYVANPSGLASWLLIGVCMLVAQFVSFADGYTIGVKKTNESTAKRLKEINDQY